MGAALLCAQLALSFLPNIEIVTLLIVIFTKNLGREGTAACLVYSCLTALIWGFGLWWVTYLFLWSGFSLLVFILRKNESFLIWAVINGAFGLFFGAFFALPYVFISPAYALSYWIAGIPWDITHCVSNVIITLLLGKTLNKAISTILYENKVKKS